MNQENKNLVLLVIIVVGIMAGWHYFYDAPRMAEAQQQTVKPVINEVVPEAAAPAAQAICRADAVKSTNRVKITTPTLSGSINPTGALIDDLTLINYNQTIKPDSEKIELLSPEGTDNPYNIQLGWASTDKSLPLPTNESAWTTDATDLTPEKPVTFSLDNGSGLLFKKTFAVDKDYLFTVNQTVTNNTNKAIQLVPTAKIRRVGTPKTSGYMVLHEGPIGVFNNTLAENKYEDLKENKKYTYDSTGGWIGITDQFWLTAFIPNQKQNYKFFETFNPANGQAREYYETGYLGDAIEIKPGETKEITNNVFAGAKVLNVLDKYEVELNVPSFDKSIDFGWFKILTKPLFYFMQYLHQLVGNFGVAILIITVIFRVLLFPLANKSFKSMARMKQLQPKMEEIKKKYGDDKMKMNQEVMEMYKREKVNPLGGCLPMLLQIPIFFALYKVLFVSIEMRHAPFFGWIQDLSAPDPTSVFNLFGLIPWDPPAILMIGAWPLLMGATMIIQQKLNPAPADPVQAKMFMFMPIIFTYMFAAFPAGLVIYWAWGNILSMAQQWVIMRSVENAKPSGKRGK